MSDETKPALCAAIITETTTPAETQDSAERRYSTGACGNELPCQAHPDRPDVAAATDSTVWATRRVLAVLPDRPLCEWSEADLIAGAAVLNTVPQLLALIDELRAENERLTTRVEVATVTERRLAELETYCLRLLDEHDDVDSTVTAALGRALAEIAGMYPTTCEHVHAAVEPLFTDNRFRRERVATLEARIATLEAVTGPTLGCCGRYAVEHKPSPYWCADIKMIACDQFGTLADLKSAPPEYLAWLESLK